MRIARTLIIQIAVAAAVLLWPDPVVHAQSSGVSCTANVASVVFGSITASSGSQTNALVTYSCSGGNANTNVRGCLALGPGSGGAAGGNSPRYMRRSDNAILNYNLRTSANGTIWSTTEVITSIPLGVTGTGTATVTIFADVSPGQTNVQTGSYSSTFTGASNVSFSFGPGGSCNTTGVVNSFTVTANITASCTLSVAPLAFGSISSISNNIDASTSITANCTSGAPYSISLGLGNGAGVTDPAARKMTKSSDTLTYGIYRDPARTSASVWGDLTTNDFDGNGAGTAQSIPVYGRIPPQPVPPSGTYSDTVIVTITY
jgi:spore coat protein U-like protein